jgi:hypothetical protein
LFISEDHLPADLTDAQKSWLLKAADNSSAGKITILMTPIRHFRGREVCLYPADYLRDYTYSQVLESKFNIKNHSPIPLSQIAPAYNPKSSSKILLGNFWPTYYHMALEEHYPGEIVPILDKKNKEIGKASRMFLDQVRWEGSGFRTNGDRIRWEGKGNAYRFYKDAVWGYGAGQGYHVFPYRTIALNFPGLCVRLYPEKKDCGKSDVIGTLVFIEEVAVRKIRMQDGKIHDGYFCATDTGSPDFIKDDRIDIFVGVHGGGNPYLPAERQFNLLISGGIENVVPSDWKLWTAENTRVWCEKNKLPVDLKNPEPDDCTHDYHVQAIHKALTMYAIKNDQGKYVKCTPLAAK